MRPTRISVAAAAVLVLLTGALVVTAGATPTPTSAVLHTRIFNDCPSSTITTNNNYPASISIEDANLDCFGFANLHNWRFSTDGVNPIQFNNGDSFRFSADLVVDGTGGAEAGLLVAPWWSPDVDGRFNVRIPDGEVAVFGGRLPFYSFTASDGVVYAAGNPIHLQITYLANGNSAGSPATVEYQVTYGGATYSSGYLAFDEGNASEDPPHGLWGMLTPAYIGGHFQPRLGNGVAVNSTATWSNIDFQPIDQSAVAMFPRVFNDCPSSELTVVNAYPALISFDDEMLDCFGFANLHVWRFSDDGVTARQFQNYSNFSFGADVVISGDGNGEAGLQISPWWSPYVDGRFNIRTPDGEIACFGGRLPFYSFTADQGLHYVKGDPIHLSMTYHPHLLNAAHPATIEYGVVYGGMTYSSGELPFDMGNAGEDPPHGLWGMLSPAYAGGHFQPRLGNGVPVGVQATWSNLTYSETPPEMVDIDIKPGSCPNPLNLKEKGMVTVAILGSDSFDVHDIDASTIRLAGVPAKKSRIEDVASPYTGELCGCSDAGGDGYDDLKVLFSAQDLVSQLGMPEFKDEVTLTLTGFLSDETAIVGQDCVMIVGAPHNIGGTKDQIADTPGPGDQAVGGPLSLNVRDDGSAHRIQYVLPEAAQVTLSVFDVTGRMVDRVVQSYEAAGDHTVSWNAASHPNGIYFYQLRSGGKVVTKKVVLLRQ